jgi:phage anti-repressor protein
VVGLIAAYKNVGVEFIEIPSGDEKQHKNAKGFNLLDYPNYGMFVKEVISNNSQGTANSIKKNLLPDLAVLQVFDRYDEKKQLIDSGEKRIPKYFKINKNCEAICDDANKLNNYISQNFFLKFNDLIECIFLILNETGKLTMNEFMLFVTWFNWDYKNQKADSALLSHLIDEYRKIPKSVSLQINQEIMHYANPKNPEFKESNKSAKRDYHNWRNETQQIFGILKEFSLFKFDEKNDAIVLDGGSGAKKNDTKFKRSNLEKEEYFKQHKVEKCDYFELDHIIPFSMIEGYEMYLEIDHWKNLIYIDSNTHSKKTRNYNKYMFLDGVENLNELNMVAPDGKRLSLVNGENALFDIDKIKENIAYNNFLKNKYNF